MTIKYNNLDTCKSFNKLKELPVPNIKDELNPKRILSYNVEGGAGLKYNYSTKKVNDDILECLQSVADEQQVIEKYKLLLSGEVMNPSENRKVLHHHCRNTKLKNQNIDEEDLSNFYSEQKNRIYYFANKVHHRKIVGSTGHAFDTVVQLGIGGSDLGPRAIHMALRNFSRPAMDAYFISNVDPDDPNDILQQIDFETTLFVVVSKSGTTQETLTNQEYIIDKMKQASIPGLNPLKHFVAVTSKGSPLENDNYLATFFIDDNIGGRYSSTSAVGGVVLSLALGSETFEKILKGANEEDLKSLNSNIRENPALLDALIGVYEQNVLKMHHTAVVPYAEALKRFPAHLQQLDMESNGKSVNRFGERVDYETGPSIFGEPGTNSQHSFFQFFHQGTTVVPIQFMGFKHPQIETNLEFQGSFTAKKLNANLFAQITALALGKEDNDLNKHFDGERPTSLLYGDKLTPELMGAILSHFENKVMFQGFLWNINSFDQEGVQLGKTLARKVLENNMDPILETLTGLLI